MIDRAQIAERAVLGALLLDNTLFEDVETVLRAEDFVSGFHRKIFGAIRSLISEKINADAITVSNTIGEDGDRFLEVVDIMQSVFSTANIKHYAEIVRNESRDRRILCAANEVIKSVHEQIDERLDYAQQRFAEIADEQFSETVCVADFMGEVLAEIEDRFDKPEALLGLETGFLDMDKITQGLQGGDLVVLAARPAMGKTLLAMNIAEHVAIKKQQPAVIFSLEMSKEQLLKRSFSSIAKTSADNLRSGKLSPEDWKKIQSSLPAFAASKLFIDDRSFMRVSDIRAKARNIKREHGLSLIVVDYVQLLGGDGENETLRIGAITRDLKLLARDLGVPIIAICQLNRGLENRTNKRPLLADLRQSGAIEQDADLVLFIFREEVYDPKPENFGIAEIIIAKQRCGSIGNFYLKFNSQFCRFDNLTGYVPSTPKKHHERKGWQDVY